MTARIGIGGLAANRRVVMQQLRSQAEFELVDLPSLRGKVPPWVLLYRIWHYMDHIDLYYGIAYGQWPRYLFAHLRKRKTICHWAGTDVWRVLHKPLHRWWFLLLIRHLIDKHLVVSENLKAELLTLGIDAELAPLISDLPQVDIPPLPPDFTILAYLPAHRGEFYGAPLIYELARRHPEWHVLIVGREQTPLGETLPNVDELGRNAGMSEVYPRITVLVRPTKHDGLPRMILEALNWGRYVVFSGTFPHCLSGRSLPEIEAALQTLHSHTRPNLAGSRYVRSAYTAEVVTAKLRHAIITTLGMANGA